MQQFGKDFKFTTEINNKGSRPKRVVIDKNGRKAIFKYQKYNCSEACSEKLSFEFAKVLGYECAHIELAMDEKNTLGVLNYLFVDVTENQHTDAIAFIKKDNETPEQFYSLNNIKNSLDKLDNNLFFQFLKIMVFDALVGEQDRHEENWGIIKEKGVYKLSPLYDNGCNLLRDFYNDDNAQKYYSGVKDFDTYIARSKSLIRKNDGSKYKHFELIEELCEKYPQIMKEEINNLEQLNDKWIKNIVNKIPEGIITKIHKEHIIDYVTKRKNLMLQIVKDVR